MPDRQRALPFEPAAAPAASAAASPAAADIRLRPLGSGDRDRVRRWLTAPEVRRWFGNSASAEAEITLAMASRAAICRMIEAAGTPIGYAHAMERGLLTQDDPPPGVPPGCWDCQLFIGSPEHRGQGRGRLALDLLAGEVFSTTLAVACAILVPVRNETATRAFEKVGFRWISVTDDPAHGPSWLMLRDRPR